MPEQQHEDGHQQGARRGPAAGEAGEQGPGGHHRQGQRGQLHGGVHRGEAERQQDACEQRGGQGDRDRGDQGSQPGPEAGHGHQQPGDQERPDREAVAVLVPGADQQRGTGGGPGEAERLPMA